MNRISALGGDPRELPRPFPRLRYREYSAFIKHPINKSSTPFLREQLSQVYSRCWASISGRSSGTTEELGVGVQVRVCTAASGDSFLNHLPLQRPGEGWNPLWDSGSLGF